jgi:hypothetical protein
MRKNRRLYATLLVSALSTAANAAPCTVCSSGEISKPQQALNIEEPVSLQTCGDLDNVVSFIDDSTEDCAGIRTLGGLCGCPVPENACRLCPTSFSLAESVTELDPSSSSILQSAPAGLPRTCEFIDSYLQVSSNDSELCQSTRETYQLECACEIAAEGEDDPTSPPSKGGDDNGENPQSDVSGCSVCPDGSPIGNPENKVPIEIPDSPVPIDTCEDLASAAMFVPSTSDDCINGIQLLASICGCGSTSSSTGCLMCPGGSVPEPDNVFYATGQSNQLVDYILDEYGGEAFVAEDGITCGLAAAGISFAAERDSAECFVSQLRRETCGCQPNPKMTALNWCRRISAILSFLVSKFNLEIGNRSIMRWCLISSVFLTWCAGVISHHIQHCEGPRETE